MERSKPRRTRRKSNAVTEYVCDIPDLLCDRILVDDVQRSSGANITKMSSSGGITPFAIRGTRAQVRETLRIISVMTDEKVGVMERAQSDWVQWIQEVFPDFESRAYFLPPVFIRRVLMANKTISGQSVLELHSHQKDEVPSSVSASNFTSVQESDLMFDDACWGVLYSLERFSKKEVFMCLSQFPFGSYLGEPRFASAVAHFPLPSNFPSKWSWRQGGFDLLIIHPQYGFVICKIKAVGHNTTTSKETRDKQVGKKLNEAADQLDKAEAMLSHLVSDIASGVRITKTIACPNLTTFDIQKVIFENEELKKSLCQCFHINDPVDIAPLVITKDHLSSPEDPPYDNETKKKALRRWWETCVAAPGPDETLVNRPEVYRDLIARFCGPVTTITVPSITEPRVSIKTYDQAVSHVGDCYTTHLILFPEQLQLLIRAPHRVFLTGPPGTGKTVVLFLMAAEWLRNGNDVIILSSWERSLVATYMLCHLLKRQLQEMPTHGCVRVLRKSFADNKEVESTLDEITPAANNQSLYVIADEAGPDNPSERYKFREFCASLQDRVQNTDGNLYFWAASCQRCLEPDDRLSEDWESASFTRPLRSPPSVIREIQKSTEIARRSVLAYTERGPPDHSDGPPVKWIYHQSQKHGSSRVEDCYVCGRKMTMFLRKTIRLGVTSISSDPTPVNTDGSPTSTRRAAPGLRYKDVLLLSWVELDENAGFLKPLREAQFPVRVMKDSDIQDVATARSDVIWAARQHLVCGLERKVVVCLHNYDDSKGKYVFTRLLGMSRCSSQLLVVCPPPGYDEMDVSD